MPALIEAKSVSKSFGGVQALSDVSITAEPGQVVGLIGPNGAGKSTLVGCITGMVQIDHGSVLFKDREITRLPPHRRARLGVSRTFQKLRLANDLTVFENVAAGLFTEWFREPITRWLRRALAPTGRTEVQNPVAEALRLTGIDALRDDLVGTLPYGQRHFVELARALVSEPAVLLLDEPATGMTEPERDRLVEIVAGFCARDRAVILIEHDLELVGRMCDAVTVIDHGQRIFTGTPGEAQKDPAVVAAYLGTARLGTKEGVHNA